MFEGTKFVKEDRDGEDVCIPTTEWKEYQHRNKLLIRLEKHQIPSHAVDLDFDSLIAMEDTKERMKTYCQNFKEKFKSIHLYFWSKENGTQKTTTASIIAKHLISQGLRVEFVLMSQLSKLLTQENYDEDTSTKIKKYKECDLLIIDDCFDPKKVTVYKSGYQIPFLDTFLRERLEGAKLATILTSNYSITEIKDDIFGLSMKTMIARSCYPFHFDTPFSCRNNFNPDDLWG